MNEMIKAERNKICSRKQTRMLFLAGVVLIVAYFFFFQFNYQNVFYDYDLEKMALASGFTANVLYLCNIEYFWDCSLDNYYIVFKCSNEFSCYSAYYFLRHLLLASCV